MSNGDRDMTTFVEVSCPHCEDRLRVYFSWPIPAQRTVVVPWFEKPEPEEPTVLDDIAAADERIRTVLRDAGYKQSGVSGVTPW